MVKFCYFNLTIFRHRHCFLLSVATDGKDERGMKLEKVGPTFSILNAMPGKIATEFIMVSASW